MELETRVETLVQAGLFSFSYIRHCQVYFILAFSFHTRTELVIVKIFNSSKFCLAKDLMLAPYFFMLLFL